MKAVFSACLLALSVSFAASAMADCSYPKLPADPPSGTTATKEEMIAAKKVTTQYSNDVDVYLKCLDDEAAAAIAALGAEHTPEQEEPIKNKLNLKADAADRTRQKYVDTFNSELRAYKAKQTP